MRCGARRLIVGVALTLVVAGCGESPSVTMYKKGEYQGKQDTHASAGEPFKGDKAAWQAAIKSRTKSQDEYSRSATN